jgi:YVTN family beta-propeller protein
VTNLDGNTVSVINTTNDTVITTMPVGNGPFGATVTPNETKVYVTNSDVTLFL